MAFRRRSFRTRVRRRNNWLWVRDSRTNLTPAATGPNNEDLMLGFRTTSAWSINLPDIVVWRIIIKISIGFKFNATTNNANTGVGVFVFCEDRNITLDNQFLSSYSRRFLVWDEMYATESIKNGAFAPVIDTTTQHYMYKEYDLKAHYRLQQVNESPFLQLVDLGNSVMTDYNYTFSMLLKLGRR